MSIAQEPKREQEWTDMLVTAPLLTPDQVCAQLGIRRRTLYEMVQTQRIEHIKLNGRLLRFRQHQLDAWIDLQVVPVRHSRRLRNVR